MEEEDNENQPLKPAQPKKGRGQSLQEIMWNGIVVTRGGEGDHGQKPVWSARQQQSKEIGKEGKPSGFWVT